jgi:hypothetical protein
MNLNPNIPNKLYFEIFIIKIIEFKTRDLSDSIKNTLF